MSDQELNLIERFNYSSKDWFKHFDFRVVNDTQPSALEKQRLMLGYSIGISLFSPMANLYQVNKLYNYKNIKVKSNGLNINGIRLCSRIYPQQILLRMLQLNLSTPIKENLSAWPAFASIGILQGAVYGHANIYFAKQLLLTNNNNNHNYRGSGIIGNMGTGGRLTYKNIFRGSGFAAIRDMISQGIPFMFCDNIRYIIYEPLLENMINYGIINKNSNFYLNYHYSITHWSSLITISIISTYLSQGIHNCQVAMQTHNNLNYFNSIKHMYSQHKIKFLWKGVESRVVLLLITNIFNEIFLKPAWGRK